MTQSPAKAKTTEPTGEKRKADSDAEIVEEDGPGSPLRQRAAEEDEDLRRITTALHTTPHHSCYNILQLYSDSGSDIISEAETHNMSVMDLGGLNIDSVASKGKITIWVREKISLQ